jgi:HEAT repeat protein
MSASRDRWKNAIARVEVTQSGGEPPVMGTAFLVRPTLALTALHVVADMRQNPPRWLGPITLVFLGGDTTSAKVYLDRYDVKQDWVLLECDPLPPAREPLSLCRTVEDEAPWKSFGYPEGGPDTGFDLSQGAVASATSSVGEVRAYALSSEDLGKDVPGRGLSGAPVLVNGQVVGLLRAALLRSDPAAPEQLPLLVKGGRLYACPAYMVLDRCADVLPPDVPASPLELARVRYLKRIAEDLKNRLNASIHNARFIDLGIDTARAATLPWGYMDPASTTPYATVDEAFRARKGRLLVLGAPGAGKTTTLLHLANRLVDAARADWTAPAPFLVNLSQYRFENATPLVRIRWRALGNQPEEPAQSIEEWLVGELKRQWGVAPEDARGWLKADRLVVLLDGLDELSDEVRYKVARHLSDTFLSEHRDAAVVVSSRIQEYEDLNKEGRLRLEGAVTLQPLTDEQIEAYLDAAQAPGLRAALPHDAALREMAQTPLTLSMMTVAFGDSPPADIRGNLSFTERRHRLLEGYAERMLQRRERRARDIPFDQDPDKDVPDRLYLYSPAKVNRYLGWLAVRMSLRSQTAFSPARCYEFLAKGSSDEKSRVLRWGPSLARAVLGFLGVMVVGLALVPVSLTGFFHVLLFASFLTAVASFLRISLESRGVGGSLAAVVGCTAIVYCVAGCSGIGSWALTALVPGEASQYQIGLIAYCLMFALAMTVGLRDRQKKRSSLTLLGLTFLAFPVSFGAAHALGRPEDTALILAVVLATGQGAWMLLSALKESLRWVAVASSFGLFLFLALCEIVGVWIFGPLSPYRVFWVVAPIALLSVAFEAQFLTFFMGLILFSSLGAIAGPLGASLGMMLFLLLVLIYVITPSDLPRTKKKFPSPRGVRRLRLQASAYGAQPIKARISHVQKSLADWLREVVQRSVYNPVMKVMIACTGGLPLRFTRFLDYAADAVLLKRSGSDLEFIHRLLRDHFALRELRQSWQNSRSKSQRLETIPSIGLQGESGFDWLEELARDAYPLVREAAVLALGAVGGPTILAPIEIAITDPEPAVRRAAVLSSKVVTSLDHHPDALRHLANERDREVVAAIFDLSANPDLGRWSWEKLILVGQILGNFPEDRELLRHLVRAASNRFVPDSTITQLIPPSIEEALPTFLTDSDPELRGGALVLLGGFPRCADVQQIIKMLEADADMEVRVKAARCLGRIGDARSVEPLVKALSNRNQTLAEEAARALGRIRDPRAVEPLIEALPRVTHFFSGALPAALAAIGDARAVDPLLKMLADRKDGCEHAAEALGKLGDARAVEPLIAALSDENDSLCQEAAAALAKLGDFRAVQPLIHALSDENVGRCQAAAAAALGRLGDVRAVQPLIGALSDDYDGQCQAAAAQALGRLGDAEAVQPLIDALSDKGATGCHAAAAEALGRLGDGRAVEPLIEAVADENYWVRRAAAEALGHLGDPRAIQPLLHGLRREDDAGVLETIRKSLVQLGHEVPSVE